MHLTGSAPTKEKPAMAARDAHRLWRMFRDRNPDGLDSFLRSFRIVTNPRSGDRVPDGLRKEFAAHFVADPNYSEEGPDRGRIAPALDAAARALALAGNFQRVAMIAESRGLEDLASGHRQMAQENLDFAQEVLQWADENDVDASPNHDPLMKALRRRAAQKAMWRWRYG